MTDIGRHFDQAAESTRLAEEWTKLAEERAKDAEHRAKRVEAKYLDALMQNQVLQMELAEARRKTSQPLQVKQKITD